MRLSKTFLKKQLTKYFWLLIIFINLIGVIPNLFASSKHFSNVSEEQYVELKIENKYSDEINSYSYNANFLLPMKYQIQNKLSYTMPVDPNNKSFLVQLYNKKNLLPSSVMVNYIDVPTKESLISFNFLNTVTINILPRYNLKSLLNNFFMANNDRQHTPSGVTLLEMGFH